MDLKACTGGELIERVIILRDALDDADKRHKERTSEARETLKVLENELLDRLNTLEGNSISTDFGTAYRSHRKSATIADGEAFRGFVVNSAAWDLVDFRANSTAVAAFLEKNASLPPGVNYSIINTVNVRRK